MPIEFRCTGCGRLLRTGDDTAGKTAQCPECGAMVTVPPPGSGPAVGPGSGVGGTFGGQAGGGFYTPAPPSPPASPFGPGAEPPPGQFDPDNPYQSPTQYGQPPLQQPYYRADRFAVYRVSGPATALIVTGVLGLIVQLLGLVGNLIAAAAGPHRRGVEPFPFQIEPGIAVVFGVISSALAIVIIVGAVKMKNLESYGMGMAASIIAMIPCISPCCLLGLPFGIWALVVLSDASVKAAFRS